jgi:NAD(P)-dependent dehydrogenase (short-subunit alcohol dehydrogenase family)
MEKKLVLITGVDTSSIAKGICKKFLTEGYEAIITHNNKFSEGSDERLKLEIEFQGLPILRFENVDFRSKESVLNLIQRLKPLTFDVIVNCASSLAMTAKGELRHEFSDFDYDEFNDVLQYNITTIAAMSIGLKDSIVSGGAIVNVTSSAAEEGAFATISYNASKAAVRNLTQSLANNFGGYNGIRVNSVAPGWIPPSSNVAAEGIVALADAFTPNDNRGKPDDVANAVFYLAKAPFANGANIGIDGGITSSYLMYLVESLELDGNDMDNNISELIKLANTVKVKLKNN